MPVDSMDAVRVWRDRRLVDAEELDEAVELEELEEDPAVMISLVNIQR